VLATSTHDFPIYSQTFVYQELDELARGGFDLRFVYSRLGSKRDFPPRLATLWSVKRRSFLFERAARRDMARFHRRMPRRVQSLTRDLCEASGMTYNDLVSHPHYIQAFSFTRLVDAFRPAYLHSYFFYERSFFCLVAGELLGVPHGLTCYADHLLDDYELKLVPFQLARCDVVVATSERIKRELLELCPAKDPDEIIVKPNAIQGAHFPAARRDEPAAGEPFRLISVCRLEPKKGLADLVDAVHRLRGEGRAVEAHLVGEADAHSRASQDYASDLRGRIERLGLAGVVHFEGRRPQPEIVRLLHASHVFVAPFVETESGDKDGIPTALLEGMATASPVVATDAGSITEVVTDGLDGLIVPQRDPVRLAAAIATLLDDPVRRSRLGAAAAERVHQAFDVEVCEGRFHDRIRARVAARTVPAEDGRRRPRRAAGEQ
jgi:glycosyltransferase involved in cell wall biosynthesis